MQDEQTSVVEESPVVETVENTETTTDNATSTETKAKFIPESRFTQVYAQKKALERENAELRARATGNQGGPSASAVDEDKAPNPQDPKYADNEAQYYADVASFSGRQAYRQEHQKQSQLTQQQQFATRQQAASSNYLQKVSQEVAKDPSFEQKLEELNSLQFGGATTLLMEESEHAGLLAKHLAENIGEAYRIRELSITDPLKAAVEIGKLEMKLQGTSQPAKVTRTQAPDPINIVKGGGKTTPGYTPGESSVSDYIKTYYPPPG